MSVTFFFLFSNFKRATGDIFLKCFNVSCEYVVDALAREFCLHIDVFPVLSNI